MHNLLCSTELNNCLLNYLRCTSLHKTWTFKFVPRRFFYCYEGLFQSCCCKSVLSHHLQAVRLLPPVLLPDHRIESLSLYMLSYYRKWEAFVTYSNLVQEVPSCHHSVCTRLDQIEPIDFIIAGFHFWNIHTFLPVIHNKKNRIFEQNFLSSLL